MRRAKISLQDMGPLGGDPVIKVANLSGKKQDLRGESHDGGNPPESVTFHFFSAMGVRLPKDS